MTTIRICEESDALLMIREGCLKEYVNMWSAQYPQNHLIPQMRELHSKYGIGLSDARIVARAMGAEEDVIFEIGENVQIKKKNDSLIVYHKKGDIWVPIDGGIDVFDSEDILSNKSNLSVISLCDEDRILHAKSVKALAESILEVLSCWRLTKGMLFSFGKHEIWKLSDGGLIRIYSSSLQDLSIDNSEVAIARHIERYRKVQRLEFGAF